MLTKINVRTLTKMTIINETSESRQKQKVSTRGQGAV